MDETPLTFDCPSSRTVDMKGSKTVTVKTTGNEKNHFTVVLCCLADGTKLAPMLIFKRKTMPKQEIPPRVIVHCQEKGWMDESGMKTWFQKVWERRSGGLLKKESPLGWDAFRAHLTQRTKEAAVELKTHLAVIPGGLASMLQPLDVSINKPFKQAIRHEWNQFMMSPEQQTQTATGRTRKASAHVCQWILKARDSIKKVVIVKSFKKTGISNALDGADDDAIYESDCEESVGDDVLDKFGKITVDESEEDESDKNYVVEVNMEDSEDEFTGFYDQ